MNRVLVLAVAAPLVMIGAADPKGTKLADGAETAATADAPITYRPCRPGPGDDRCIQLYERGVRASYARWLRDRGHGPAPAQVAAVGGPVEPAPAPRRHPAGGDHRCPPADHDGEARGM
jgi:hypothetical protein